MIRLLVITSLTAFLLTGCGAENTTSSIQTSVTPKTKVHGTTQEPENAQQSKSAKKAVVNLQKNVEQKDKQVSINLSNQLPSETEKIKQNTKVNEGNLNGYVLGIIDTYTQGSYPYLLNNDYNNYNGVTTNIVYQGNVIAKAHPSGNRASHCVGLTFEVFFKAMQQRNSQLGLPIDNFNGMNKYQLQDFMLTWYVANGSKANSNLAVAVEKYGIGKRITNLEDARPGDFIDLSRENNSGHAVVFIDWVRVNGQIIGLKYWSTQQSTNGIGYKTEYFNIPGANGKKYGNVIKNNLYIARILPVTEYKNFI